MAVEAHQGPVADWCQSADDARGGQSDREQHDDGEARQRLCREKSGAVTAHATSRCRQVPSRSSLAKTSPATRDVSSGSTQLQDNDRTTNGPAQPV
jgi:hypothetical protein